MDVKHQKGSERLLLWPLYLGFIAMVVEYFIFFYGNRTPNSNVLLAIIPAILVLAVVRWFAKPEMVKISFLHKGFLYGALPVIALATVLSLLLAQFKIPGYLVAGFAEEGVKGLVIVLLLRKWGLRYRPNEVLLFGMAIGAGFAFTENMLYFMQPDDSMKLGLMFIGRGLITPFAHPFFTGILGYYIGKAMEGEKREKINYKYVATGFLIAACAHSAFDWSTKYLSVLSLTISIVALIGIELHLTGSRSKENKVINKIVVGKLEVLSTVERLLLTSIKERNINSGFLNKELRGNFNTWVEFWRDSLLNIKDLSEEELKYLHLLATDLRKNWDVNYLSDKNTLLGKIDLVLLQDFIITNKKIIECYLDPAPILTDIQTRMNPESIEYKPNQVIDFNYLEDDKPLDDPYGLI